MADDRVFAKCAWRLIPFIMVMLFANLLDRVNAGFAALTMNRDLGFTPAVFGFGAGLVFLSYALFQLPANIVLARVGAKRFVFSIMTLWAVLSTSAAFIQGPTEFYIQRFLLGAAESGFFPGMTSQQSESFCEGLNPVLGLACYHGYPEPTKTGVGCWKSARSLER
jgi:MFS transporter, ACS family, tartrate transporter